MSAPALSPSPQAAHGSRGPAPRRRGHLRLVTEDFVPQERLAPSADLAADLPEGVGCAGGTGPGWSPNHPAVRAARMRVPGASTPEGPGQAGGTAGVAGAGWAALPHEVRRVVLAVAVVLAFAVAAGAGTVVSSVLAGPVPTTTAVVGQGQSLWQVAEATGTSDVAETVARIVELNDLDSETVHAGQALLVPVD